MTPSSQTTGSPGYPGRFIEQFFADFVKLISSTLKSLVKK